MRLGADIVECDVAKTSDGGLFVFHDGGEMWAFRESRNIKTLTSDEVRRLRYFNCIGAATNQKVQTFDEILSALKGDVLINVDRAWEYWEDIIEAVERHGMAEQIILKSPVKDPLLESLETAGRRYMYMPMAASKDEIDRVLSCNLNILAVEINFQSDDQDIVSPEYLELLRKKGLLLWCNSIKLNHRDVLAGAFDDDISVLCDPDRGWGRLLDMGFDIIQTDWPGPLKEYIVTRGYHLYAEHKT